VHEIIEETIRQARRSPHINQASGVSVRASIAALEVAVSAAELRAVRTGEHRVTVRPTDLAHIAAALRGKIELMLSEDSPDGVSTEDRLIMALVGEATKAVLARVVQLDAVASIAEPFATGLKLAIDDTTTTDGAIASMKHVPGLIEAGTALARALEMDPKDPGALACAGELILEFLYVHNRLSKVLTRSGGTAYAR
jgi:magnesium chelatase subunit I